MSTPPEAPTGADASKPPSSFEKCWSCRIISGGGLILAGAYVYFAARKVLQHGGPVTIGTVAQISFAASLAAWGFVILTDPVGKSKQMT